MQISQAKQVHVMGPAGTDAHLVVRTMLGANSEVPIAFHQAHPSVDLVGDGSLVVSRVGYASGNRDEASMAPWLARLEEPAGSLYRNMRVGRQVVVGEAQMVSTRCLAGIQGASLEGARRVLSSAETLARHAAYLRLAVPRAELVAVSGAAAAAELVARGGDAETLALCSPFAANCHRLFVVSDAPSRGARRQERFHFIGDRKLAPPPTGRDRTAIMFQVPNAPLSLLPYFAMLTPDRVNMAAMVVSLANEEGISTVYLELDCHFLDVEVGRRTADRLAKIDQDRPILWLGSYPQSEAPVEWP